MIKMSFHDWLKRNQLVLQIIPNKEAINVFISTEDNTCLCYADTVGYIERDETSVFTVAFPNTDLSIKNITDEVIQVVNKYADYEERKFCVLLKDAIRPVQVPILVAD